MKQLLNAIGRVDLPSTGNAPRLFYADAIRAYAIVSVVFLHIVSPIVADPSSVSRSGWWTANLYDAFLRPCVPLFVLVSGLFLLDGRKREPLGLFVKKRVMKVLIPFVFWGLVYVQVKARVQGTHPSALGFLSELVTGPVYTHFWFIYMILGLYVVTPLLRLYRASAPIPLQYVVVAVWALAVSLAPLVGWPLGAFIGARTAVVVQFSGYFLLGPLLRERVLGNAARAAIVAPFVACGVFTAVGTAMVTDRSGGMFNGVFYDYTSPAVIVMSVCAFLILGSFPWERIAAKDRMLSAVVTQLSALSLGVYLVHYLLVEWLRYGKFGIVLPGTGWPLLIGAPVTAAIACIASLGVVWCIRMVPLGRYIVP